MAQRRGARHELWACFHSERKLIVNHNSNDDNTHGHNNSNDNTNHDNDANDNANYD